MIVNERAPVTFTWLSSNEPLVLTDAVAEAAGLERNSADADRVVIRVEPNRTLSASPATVATIRLGQHILHDVDALVLPPEAEDLGARIGVDAWSGYNVTLQLDRLRLVMHQK
jgi:hypothetical protein